MLVHLACFAFIIALIMPTSVGQPNFCSRLTNCEQCDAISLCTWLDSSCKDDTSTSISDNPSDYNQAEDYINCVNAVDQGYIVLDDIESMSVVAAFNSSATVGTLCRWEIVTANEMTTTVTINRGSTLNNYEDINLYLYTGYSSGRYYTNRGLTDCEQTSFTIELDSVEFVSLYVELQSMSSGFGASISQTDNGHKGNLLTILLVCGLLGIIVCTVCACFCLVFAQCKVKIDQRYQEMANQRRREIAINNRTVRVPEVMSKMRNGEYKNISTKYSQASCVICLEDFTEDDMLHITNECSHAFHSKCLNEWYVNIDPTKDLTCPHCNTINTKDSTPMDEDVHVESIEDDPADVGRLEETKQPIYDIHRMTSEINDFTVNRRQIME